MIRLVNIVHGACGSFQKKKLPRLETLDGKIKETRRSFERFMWDTKLPLETTLLRTVKTLLNPIPEHQN